MLSQAITVQLRLPGLAVWGVEERAETIEVVAQYMAPEAVCPRCDQPTCRCISCTANTSVTRSFGKQVWILIWKRRFRCRRCRYVFMEPDPSCGRRRRTTCRLRSAVAQQAEETKVRTVARWHGVSEGLVQRSWLEAHLAPAAVVVLAREASRSLLTRAARRTRWYKWKPSRHSAWAPWSAFAGTPSLRRATSNGMLTTTMWASPAGRTSRRAGRGGCT